MPPFVVRRTDFNYYKTVGLSLSSNVIISWFVYALFAENYLGHQFFNNIGYLFIPVLRPDFIIYLVVIPIMTTFWNIIYQTRETIKYYVKIYPLMYMMTPFFLDNYYFLLNHVPLEARSEIQFVFISSPTILTYIFLTVFYFIVGFIAMFKANRIWQVFLISAFALAEFSSLIISSILEPQILELAIYIAAAVPVYGIFVANQLRLWWVSFGTNSDLYLTTYILLVIIIALIFTYLRYKIGKDWWDKTPVEVSESRITKLIVVLEDRKSKTEA